MSETVNCPCCGQAVKATAVLCKHCRSDLRAPSVRSEGDVTAPATAPPHVPSPTKTCPSCGKQVRSAAALCRYCRADLTEPTTSRTDWVRSEAVTPSPAAGASHAIASPQAPAATPTPQAVPLVPQKDREERNESTRRASVEEPFGSVVSDGGGGVARGGKRALWITAALAVTVGVAVAGWFVLQRPGSSPAPGEQAVVTSPGVAAAVVPTSSAAASGELSEAEARRRLKAFFVGRGLMPATEDLYEFERQGDGWEGVYAEEGRFLAMGRINAKTGECEMEDAGGDLVEGSGSATADRSGSSPGLTEEERVRSFPRWPAPRWRRRSQRNPTAARRSSRSRTRTAPPDSTFSG